MIERDCVGTSGETGVREVRIISGECKYRMSCELLSSADYLGSSFEVFSCESFCREMFVKFLPGFASMRASKNFVIRDILYVLYLLVFCSATIRDACNQDFQLSRIDIFDLLNNCEALTRKLL